MVHLEEERVQVDRLEGRIDDLTEELRIANLLRSESDHIKHLKQEIDKLKNDLRLKEAERKFFEELITTDNKKMDELKQEHAKERQQDQLDFDKKMTDYKQTMRRNKDLEEKNRDLNLTNIELEE